MRTFNFWFFFVVFSSGIFSGCVSTHYGYFPVAEKETVSMSERGASFPVKLGSSEGTLHAMSLGIVHLKSETKPVQYSSLHLGVIVFNAKGTQTWVVSSRDLKVQLSDLGASIPAYVKSNSTEASAVSIPPGTAKRLDLYYPLPPDHQTPANFPGFNFLWKVSSGKDSVSESTPFVRQQTHLSHKDPELNVGIQHQNMVWDMEENSPSFWWYDNTYPQSMFPGMPVASPLF